MPNLKRPDEAKGIDHLKLPVGEVISDPVKGDFLGVPLFGYVSLRAQTKTPLVILVLLLLSEDSPSPKGSLKLELPVFPETEASVVSTLLRLGWDRRVWPVEEGWPTGSDDQEAQINYLMEQAQLRASMTFPPSEVGVAAMGISVQRARGPFLMPPFETEPFEEMSEAGQARFRAAQARLKEICDNPRIFYNPQKPLIFQP